MAKISHREGDAEATVQERICWWDTEKPGQIYFHVLLAIGHE
jgi:hypothetical protein